MSKLKVLVADDKREEELTTETDFKKLPTITVNLTHADVIYITVGDEALEFHSPFKRKDLSVMIYPNT